MKEDIRNLTQNVLQLATATSRNKTRYEPGTKPSSQAQFDGQIPKYRPFNLEVSIYCRFYELSDEKSLGIFRQRPDMPGEGGDK